VLSLASLGAALLVTDRRHFSPRAGMQVGRTGTGMEIVERGGFMSPVTE